MSEEKKTPEQEMEDPAEMGDRMTQEMIDRFMTREEQEEFLKSLENCEEELAEWEAMIREIPKEEKERMKRIINKLYWS